MARADRLERLEARRIELEADYRAALIAALEVTAGGKWGLFGHKRDRHQEKATAPTLESLSDMAEEIDAMRETLSLEPFALHRDFMADRGPAPANAPGEPKQARAWLDRLATA